MRQDKYDEKEGKKRARCARFERRGVLFFFVRDGLKGRRMEGNKRIKMTEKRWPAEVGEKKRWNIKEAEEGERRKKN
jgi:hypothetical protein